MNAFVSIRFDAMIFFFFFTILYMHVYLLCITKQYILYIHYVCNIFMHDLHACLIHIFKFINNTNIQSEYL